MGLARALAASPLWGEAPRARLVVHSGPPPLLAVVGYLDEGAQARLGSMLDHLPLYLQSFRYVDYAQAERDAEALAAALVERVGRDHLQRCRFVAIPRGGLIVLGMLSYLLGLRQEQLEPGPQDQPHVVVDDCALTGSRFARFFTGVFEGDLTFATLYAPPDLRRAIEQEQAVSACVSARDLHDHAPELLGEEYAAWRARWAERTERYWIGLPEQVGFAWSEPEVGVWNPVAGAVEEGWHVLPPERCLKHRRSEPALSVQVQPEGRGRLRPGARIVFADLEDEIVVGDLERGRGFSLTGVGADLWRALLQQDALGDAVEDVARAYGVEAEAVRADAEPFVRDLLSNGLLQQHGGGGEGV